MLQVRKADVPARPSGGASGSGGVPPPSAVRVRWRPRLAACQRAPRRVRGRRPPRGELRSNGRARDAGRIRRVVRAQRRGARKAADHSGRCGLGAKGALPRQRERRVGDHPGRHALGFSLRRDSPSRPALELFEAHGREGAFHLRAFRGRTGYVSVALHSLAIRFEREKGSVLREEHYRLESVFRRWRESAAPCRPYLYRLACLPYAEDLGESGVERTRETVPLAARTNERRALSPRFGAMLRVDDQWTRGIAIIKLVQALNQLEESHRPTRLISAGVSFAQGEA